MIWSKNAFIIKAGLSLTAFLVACGGDNSSKAESLDSVLREVSTIHDLGTCTADRYGDTVFVNEKAADYLCVNNDWVDLTTPLDDQSEEPESGLSSFIDEEIQSSSSFVEDTIRNDSNSTTPSQTIEKDYTIVPTKENLPACDSENAKQSVLVQADSILYTCSSNKWEPEDANGYVVKNATISGAAQKGPFKVKSSLSLSEILLRNDSLVYSGRKYSGEISGEKGNFEISKVDLIYPYAVLEVRGQWRNEISGFFSKDSITLQVLTDLGKRTEVNINLLTHLEYDRAVKLISTGRYNVYVAKTQADYEIMKAFGFTTSVECSEDLITFVSTSNASHDANAALMAISLLFIADKNDADILKSINDFKSDLAEDGSWDNEQMKVNMADWAESFDGGSVRANVNAWGVLDVPKYEDFLTIFWNNAYGLGGCDQTRYGVVSPVSNTSSKNYDVHYICKEKGWQRASDYEKDTYGWNKGTSGEVRKGNVTETYYVFEDQKWGLASTLQYDTYGITCDRKGAVTDGKVFSANKYVCDAGAFRIANETEISLGEGCVSYTENREIRIQISDYQDSIYTCKNSLWVGSVEGYDEDSVLIDKRDMKIYKIVTIGSQTWMAENLNYRYVQRTYNGGMMDTSSYCFNNAPDSCAKYGRIYLWSAAMDSAGIFSKEGVGCGYAAICSLSGKVRGVCPEGWHLPTEAEWDALLTTVGRSEASDLLKSETGWGSKGSAAHNGTNVFGFSAMPTGWYLRDGFIDSDYQIGFWSSTSADSDYAYYMCFDVDRVTLYPPIGKDNVGMPVRCIKD